MLLFSPTFVLISDSLEAPVAIAEIIALYSDGSRTSCWRRFSGSSKRAEDEFKNVFTYGEFIPEYEEMDDILAFYRTDAATSILVVANFGTDAASIELKGNVKRVLMSNQKNETVDYTKNRLNLKSCEAVVLDMEME